MFCLWHGNASGSDPASAQDKEIAFGRAALLARTINISRWFARPEPESLEHYRHYVEADELQLIQSFGFTAVRLPLREPFLFDEHEPEQLDPDRLEALDSAIRAVLDAGMAVIVDLHFKNRRRIQHDGGFQRAMIAHWSALASHLAQTTDPNNVFLELLNEPRFYGAPDQWAALQDRLHQAVRTAAPQHTIIATSIKYGDPLELAQTVPLPDENVVYTFHSYDPVAFAHQGAPFLADNVRSVSNLPWPVDQDQCLELTAAAVNQEQHTYIDEYCAAGWDRSELERYLQPVFDWADLHRVPLFAGEIGAAMAHVSEADRLAYLGDMVSVLEAHRVPWGLWSYDDCYGLALKVAGNCPTTTTGDVDQHWQRACRTLSHLGLPEGSCSVPRPTAARPDHRSIEYVDSTVN